MCRNARAARGHSGRPDAGRSRGGARFSARCRGPGSLRNRNSDKQSGCPGENRSRYRGDVRQGQSRCGSRSMAGSEPTPVAAELCHAWLILRTRPVLLEPGAVLAAVKDAARRTSERWPAAILDCCCARPPAGRQAGTKKRPPVSRTKKHDEVGNTGLPSKGVSLLPMINSEEAPVTTVDAKDEAARCRTPLSRTGGFCQLSCPCIELARVLELPVQAASRTPSAMAVRRMWRKRRVAAGTCWHMRDPERRTFRSSSWPRHNRLAESVLLKPSIGRHRLLMPRWSCSRRLLRYRFVRWRTRSPSTVRIARGYASCPSVVIRSGVTSVIVFADRKKALAAARSRCSLSITSTRTRSRSIAR